MALNARVRPRLDFRFAFSFGRIARRRSTVVISAKPP